MEQEQGVLQVEACRSRLEHLEAVVQWGGGQGEGALGWQEVLQLGR